MRWCRVCRFILPLTFPLVCWLRCWFTPHVCWMTVIFILRSLGSRFTLPLPHTVDSPHSYVYPTPFTVWFPLRFTHCRFDLHTPHVYFYGPPHTHVYFTVTTTVGLRILPPPPTTLPHAHVYLRWLVDLPRLPPHTHTPHTTVLWLLLRCGVTFTFGSFCVCVYHGLRSPRLRIARLQFTALPHAFGWLLHTQFPGTTPLPVVPVLLIPVPGFLFLLPLVDFTFTV